MNLELRKGILGKSLEIEAKLSELLMILLDIKTSDNKSFGYKGSALSLKSKVDLLYDINKITKVVHSKLIMFMEIRNQFIHNVDSNSYKVVLNRISKKSKLLNLFDVFVSERDFSISKDIEEEDKFKFGFEMLVIEILEELESTRKAIIQDRIEIIEAKLKQHEIQIHEKFLKVIGDAIDEATTTFNKRWQESFKDDKDIGKSLRVMIQALINKKIEDEHEK